MKDSLIKKKIVYCLQLKYDIKIIEKIDSRDDVIETLGMSSLDYIEFITHLEDAFECDLTTLILNIDYVSIENLINEIKRNIRHEECDMP